MRLYRISNHAKLDGEGGLRASGRWHTKGRPVLYCAASPAAAVLEILVHLEIDAVDFPADYQLLTIDIADDVPMTTVKSNTLPQDWWTDLAATRAIGDNWLQKGKTLPLAVPSAIAPETRNYLLNPQHPESVKARIKQIANYRLDERLRR